MMYWIGGLFGILGPGREFVVSLLDRLEPDF